MYNFKNLSYDELITLYTDLGAMGSEMDCDSEYWDAICKEIQTRESVE